MVIVLLGVIVLISSLASGNCWGIVSGLVLALGAAFFSDQNYQK